MEAERIPPEVEEALAIWLAEHHRDDCFSADLELPGEYEARVAARREYAALVNEALERSWPFMERAVAQKIAERLRERARSSKVDPQMWTRAADFIESEFASTQADDRGAA